MPIQRSFWRTLRLCCIASVIKFINYLCSHTANLQNRTSHFPSCSTYPARTIPPIRSGVELTGLAVETNFGSKIRYLYLPPTGWNAPTHELLLQKLTTENFNSLWLGSLITEGLHLVECVSPPSWIALQMWSAWMLGFEQHSAIRCKGYPDMKMLVGQLVVGNIRSNNLAVRTRIHRKCFPNKCN